VLTICILEILMLLVNDNNMGQLIKTLALLIALISTSQVWSMNKVIYGLDNREELSQSPFSYLNNSVASMVYKSARYDYDEEISSFLSSDLTEYRAGKTCSDMRFREQTTLATCSGFLISDELLVTAGHCVLNYGQYANNTYTGSCSQNFWIFNYGIDSIAKDEVIVSSDDVYNCDKIVDGAYTDTKDYAIVKLGRKVVGKTPVKLNLNFDYTSEEEIFVVGNPSGLPTKISNKAQISDSSQKHFFTSNLDTFAGNSGSAIFNSSAEVIGILVSGETDYVLDQERSCYMVNHCVEDNGECIDPLVDKASGETGTKITVLNRYFNK